MRRIVCFCVGYFRIGAAFKLIQFYFFRGFLFLPDNNPLDLYVLAPMFYYTMSEAA